jgi:sporulation protein YlmC with PRC-barrel domain
MQSAIKSGMSSFSPSLAVIGLLVLAPASYAQPTPGELPAAAECPALRGTEGIIAPGCAAKQDKIAANSTTTTLKTDSLAPPREFGPAGFGLKLSGAILASDLLSQPVFSLEGKQIGKINDVVMTRNFESVVAVIGFGGFLGLGSKNIAIPVDRINIAEDGNEGIKLSINSTWEQLQAAPSFDRTALMR